MSLVTAATAVENKNYLASSNKLNDYKYLNSVSKAIVSFTKIFKNNDQVINFLNYVDRLITINKSKIDDGTIVEEDSFFIDTKSSNEYLTGKVLFLNALESQSNNILDNESNLINDFFSELEQDIKVKQTKLLEANFKFVSDPNHKFRNLKEALNQSISEHCEKNNLQKELINYEIGISKLGSSIEKIKNNYPNIHLDLSNTKLTNFKAYK